MFVFFLPGKKNMIAGATGQYRDQKKKCANDISAGVSRIKVISGWIGGGDATLNQLRHFYYG